jgi:osmotically-inducible protein OsmY
MKPIVSVITFALGASSPTLICADGVKLRAQSGVNAPTSQDQSNAPEDLKLTQNIRRAFVKDSSLSTAAKNLKVITISGKVTLRGTVKSAEEKARIMETAEKHAGSGNVADHIEVKAKP